MLAGIVIYGYIITLTSCVQTPPDMVEVNIGKLEIIPGHAKDEDDIYIMESDAGDRDEEKTKMLDSNKEKDKELEYRNGYAGRGTLSDGVSKRRYKGNTRKIIGQIEKKLPKYTDYMNDMSKNATEKNTRNSSNNITQDKHTNLITVYGK